MYNFIVYVFIGVEFGLLSMPQNPFNHIHIYIIILRRRVSSVVEHSSANPKVSGLIPGLVSYRGHGL